LLLTLPSEDYVGALMKVIDPDAVHAARQLVKKEIALALQDALHALYAANHRPQEAECLDAEAMGRRRLKNTCLSLLAELERPDAYALCCRQYQAARNMSDQIAALSCMVNSRNPETSDYLERFYQQWQDEALVIDKWFALQATRQGPGALADVKALLGHPAFNWETPNRVRSLIAAFSQNNPVNFHALDGEGYRFLGDHIINLNALNPQLASRMAAALTQWRRYDEARQALMRGQLQRIAAAPGISKDVYEVVAKSLA
jgi:aminopeptidase N